ncbi:MAG: hypothetical protein ND895_27320 [Pyrinomonadaceae bacterium]|nr:hypothetical protein [Pyrinomonadaceae bacterium]
MNRKNRIRRPGVLVVILCLLPTVALATSQQPDVLIHKGKSFDLFANPLEGFYKGKGTRPSFRVKPNVISTGNWRGYVATWTIENGFLYLLKIDAWICRDWDEKTCRKVNLKDLFGSRYIQGRVRADWFSGDLRMPDGELLQYVHMGYGSVYERELTFRVESGKVVKESVVDNTQRNLPSALELERQELEKMKPRPDR